ncbi:phosphotransferase [Flavicella sediminum]|uniref:phosphotransferase n=1 Tax=Flavicella sediminum TaxID=2585141 RepID=UPI00112003C9|nr:phosphotransferase [Flavicella sediminum]
MKVLPVVTSTISEKELGEFVKETYGLHKNYNCKIFRTGMNHTYFISNQESKYVLRVYSHNWRSKTEVSAELELLQELKAQDLNVSYPIKDTKGEFIQEIKAPEGTRFLVLFSFAAGGKVRFLDKDTCFEIGTLMAKIHKLTANKNMDRVNYDKKALITLPYEYLKKYFSEELAAMKFIKETGVLFKKSDFENTQKGAVHIDIWYDNMAITAEKEITIFDFDFCGNGAQILDVGYFCKQLFHIESDKKVYELKKEYFLKGYQKNRKLSEQELQLIPKAGVAVFLFYLGVQAQRYDWSNIFLSENYLTMVYVPRIKSWMEYCKFGLRQAQPPQSEK